MRKSSCIYVVSPVYPTEAEPASGTFVKAIADGLEAQGWSIDLRATGLSKRAGKLGKLERYLRLFFGSLSLAFAKPGIVYVHLPTWFSLALWPASFRKPLPIVVNAHGSEIHARNKLAERFWPFTRAYIRKASLVVVPSRTFAKTVQAATQHHRIFISPSGGFVEGDFQPSGPDQRAHLGIPENAKVVGFVSRIVDNKGWRIFLDAMEALNTNAHPVYGVMLGTGKDSAELRRDIRARGLHDRVHYLGAVPRSTLASYFRAMDVFLFTSKIANTDTLGLVAVEAIACGTPTVALDSELTREYITQVNGSLVREWTGPAFAAAAQALLTRSSHAAERSEIALTVERFGSRVSAAKLSAEFEKIARADSNAA